MPRLSIHVRSGQRIAIFNEAGNVELIDIDNQRDENGHLVISDHVLHPNPHGCDDIYDEVAAHFCGEPVGLLPAHTDGAARQRVTPALLETVRLMVPTKRRLVA